MNEKIKQIKQDAVDEINLQYLYCPDNIHELIEQKFAELIVKECAQISEEYAYSDTLPMLISYHIKQHFGVE